jgi:hypothetical protein
MDEIARRIDPFQGKVIRPQFGAISFKLQRDWLSCCDTLFGPVARTIFVESAAPAVEKHFHFCFSCTSFVRDIRPPGQQISIDALLDPHGCNQIVSSCGFQRLRVLAESSALAKIESTKRVAADVLRANALICSRHATLLLFMG